MSLHRHHISLANGAIEKWPMHYKESPSWKMKWSVAPLISSQTLQYIMSKRPIPPIDWYLVATFLFVQFTMKHPHHLPRILPYDQGSWIHIKAMFYVRVQVQMTWGPKHPFDGLHFWTQGWASYVFCTTKSFFFPFISRKRRKKKEQERPTPT